MIITLFSENVWGSWDDVYEPQILLQKQPDRYIFLCAFPNKIRPKLNICSKAIDVVSVKVWVYSLKDLFFIESTIKLCFFKHQCFSLHISLCSVMEQFNCLHIIQSDWLYPWCLPLFQVIIQCSRIICICPLQIISLHFLL